VVVDTTVQEKAIAHPTDARLTHRAIEKLVETAKREGVGLRQSYLRVAKRAAPFGGDANELPARRFPDRRLKEAIAARLGILTKCKVVARLRHVTNRHFI
jgi:IS5 family transposase